MLRHLRPSTMALAIVDAALCACAKTVPKDVGRELAPAGTPRFHPAESASRAVQTQKVRRRSMAVMMAFLLKKKKSLHESTCRPGPFGPGSSCRHLQSCGMRSTGFAAVAGSDARVLILGR